MLIFENNVLVYLQVQAVGLHYVYMQVYHLFKLWLGIAC